MIGDDREDQSKAARKQALFREVNERVRLLHRGSSDVDFVCECADDRCSTAIHIAEDDYERVRSNPLHFVVAPEHFFEGTEILVEQGEQRWIVEVIEAGRPVAEATDPRRRPE